MATGGPRQERLWRNPFKTLAGAGPRTRRGRRREFIQGMIGTATLIGAIYLVSTQVGLRVAQWTGVIVIVATAPILVTLWMRKHWPYH